MRLTLAVTTHEWPAGLEAVLGTLARQSQSPDELIVADDGSGESTRAVVERFARRCDYPVHHVRQEHRGFRVARLRNLAITRASGDYVVFVDGDMLLHPRFIEDHRSHALRGCFTQGVRILLDAACTERMLARPGSIPSITEPGLGRLRRLYALRSPTLRRLTRRLGNAVVALKACNLGAWRDDLVAVNGFDEAFEGWGSEDKDLCARLRHAGVQRQTLLFGGIAYHLFHAPASREHRTLNEQRLAATLAERRVRCARGLDQHG